MDYTKYAALAQQGAENVEKGDYEAALEVFRALIASDISDVDKASMCYNAAFVLEKLGRETETLACYDRGMSYERMHSRSFVAEHKAAYLSRIGRQKDSLRLYEELRLRPSLTEEEKYRIAYNIDLLRQQST